MFERFTAAARDTVVRTTELGQQLGYDYLAAEHLLLALTSDPGIAGQVLTTAGYSTAKAQADLVDTEPGGLALAAGDAEALRSIGIDLDAVRASVEANFGPEALRAPAPAPRRGLFRRRRVSRFTPTAKKALELSLREAIRLGSGYIGAEHLLLGILRDERSPAVANLRRAGCTVDQLRAGVEAAIQRAA